MCKKQVICKSSSETGTGAQNIVEKENVFLKQLTNFQVMDEFFPLFFSMCFFGAYGGTRKEENCKCLWIKQEILKTKENFTRINTDKAAAT